MFETGGPPQFQLYAYDDGEARAGETVQARVERYGLDGQVDTFAFKPVEDYLVGDGTVIEPHSFDVKVSATHQGEQHQWEYASYEGRTTIRAAVAQDAGIEVEAAGPAVIRDTVRLMGRIAIDDNRHAQIRARFPGTVRPVVGPRSLDGKCSATGQGEQHQGEDASAEGRATIRAAVAQDAGIEVEAAGPAVIRDTVRLMGRIAIDDNRHAQIRARFPGTVRAVRVQQGDRVRRGQTLVVVEGNDSMRNYPVTAPFDGMVLSRNTNVGDFAGDNTLVEIADLSEVWVELHAIGKAAAKLEAGQPVRVMAATGELEAETRIDTLLPLATAGQSVVARASLPNADGRWRPGMTVNAEVTVAERRVPLAVRESGLQGFRDFTVVFAQIGETYEVRMLELGARDGEWIEVLGGLKPGTNR